MANSFPTIFLSFFFFFSPITTTAKTHSFARSISPSTLGLDDQQQKLTHIRFFFHDVVGGRNQTAVRVAAAPATDKSPTLFGAVVMMDDLLTEQPDATSRAMGRAQGIYASASQSELGFLMAMNFAFTQGRYNGSSLAVLGRNTVASAVREMPVVGGSGLFRFARGYAQAKTHTFSMLEAVVEYNVCEKPVRTGRSDRLDREPLVAPGQVGCGTGHASGLVRPGKNRPDFEEPDDPDGFRNLDRVLAERKNCSKMAKRRHF